MTSSSAPKTILLRGSPRVEEGVAKASSNIKPGMLIERVSDGTVRPHSTAAAKAAALFAREKDYVGKGIDDVYPDGENVVFFSAKKGDQFYGFLKAGQNVAKGTFLESAGDGSLRDVATTGEIVAQALEAVNANGGVNARIRLEVV